MTNEWREVPARRRVAVRALLGLALLGAAPVVLRAAPEPLARLAHEDDAGRAALKSASAARSEASKAPKEARAEALAGVASLYRAIADAAEHDVEVRAEAAFRAGELLRTAKQLQPADEAFRLATELGGQSAEARTFAARALLERAHLARRAKQEPEAIEIYERVRAEFGEQRRSAAHALTWSGKLRLRAGDLAGASERLSGFAREYPEYAAEAVRNADLLAVELLEAGDEDAARAAIEAVKVAVAPVLEAGGRKAEQCLKALDNLRVTELLAVD